MQRDGPTLPRRRCDVVRTARAAVVLRDEHEELCEDLTDRVIAQVHGQHAHAHRHRHQSHHKEF